MTLKRSLLNLIIVNTLLLILTIIFFDKSNANYLVRDLVFVSLLCFIGTIVYLLSSHQLPSKLFLILMYTAAWILLLLNGPSKLFFCISRVLMSIAPILLFTFFASLTNLQKTKLYKKFNTILIIAGFITLISLLTFIRILNIVLYLHIAISIIFCIIISYKNRSKQRNFFREYQPILTISMLVSLVPFIVSYTFLRNIVSSTVRMSSIYTFLTLPLVVGYILIKRNDIQIHIDYSLLMKKISFYFVFFTGFTLFCLFVLNLTITQFLLILLSLSIFIYCHDIFEYFSSKEQIRIANKVKEELEKEKLEIFQKVTYDDYLSSLSDMIRNLIVQTIPTNGTMIIWKEEGHTYIFEQSGIFEDYDLKKRKEKELKGEITTIQIEEKQYFSFPLIDRNIVCGWMILGEKESKKKLTTNEIKKAIDLTNTICKIIKMSEILHENQKQYTKLPNIEYDDYINLQFMHKSEMLRKELSYYLHDEVLQNILALKNMTEYLETTQSDVKELILTSYESINESLRDKMFDLYPTSLEDLSFYQSLSILCEKLKNEAVHQPHLVIRIDADSSIKVNKKLRYPIFRMVKELLQNAIKHAHANVITLSLNQENDVLWIDVIDDGIGFDIIEQLEKGFYSNHIGLLSVQQDINSLNGDLFIQHNKPAGTHIQMKIPILWKGEN